MRKAAVYTINGTFPRIFYLAVLGKSTRLGAGGESKCFIKSRAHPARKRWE